MWFDLLHSLTTDSLPQSFVDARTIEKLRALQAADLIVCSFGALSTGEPFARVLAVTKDGMAALELRRVARKRN